MTLLCVSCLDSFEKLPPDTGLPRAIDGVLQRIFNSKRTDGAPSLEDMLGMVPFTNANLNRPLITKVHLDSDCKRALKKLREGRSGGDESGTSTEAPESKAEKRKKKRKKDTDESSEMIDVGPPQSSTPVSSFDGLGSADGSVRQAVNLSLVFMLVTGLSAISHALVAIGPVASQLYGGATQAEIDWCWLLFPLAQGLFAPVAAYLIELQGLRLSVVAASVLHLGAAALRCMCALNCRGVGGAAMGLRGRRRGGG
jgi:hypothetical protein